MLSKCLEYFGRFDPALTLGHWYIWRVVGDLVSVFAVPTVAAASLMHVKISFWISPSRVQTSRTIMINVWVWLWCAMIVSVVQWRWVVCIDAWKMWIFVICVIMIEVKMVVWMDMWEVPRKGVRTNGVGMYMAWFDGFGYVWGWMVCFNGSGGCCFVWRLVTGIRRISVVCGICCWELVIDCVKIIGWLAWGASIWGGVGKTGATDRCCREVTCWAARVGWVSSRRRRRHEDWWSWSPVEVRRWERALGRSWGWKIWASSAASGCRFETFKDIQFCKDHNAIFPVVQTSWSRHLTRASIGTWIDQTVRRLPCVEIEVWIENCSLWTWPCGINLFWRQLARSVPPCGNSGRKNAFKAFVLRIEVIIDIPERKCIAFRIAQANVQALV